MSNHLPPEGSSPPSERVQILLVDDEPNVLKITRRLLEVRGYAVDTADNAPEAVQTFREDPERYDLVLLDRNMPGMSGIEALEAFREIDEDVRTLLMSGAPDDAMENARPTGMLLKPYGLEELQAAVNAALAA